MPRILPKRKAPVVDMTAMCDVAFLLLTFFILTAKFKPQAAVAVDVPAATSTKTMDSVCTIIINKEGKAYIALKNENDRAEMMNQLIDKYGNKYPGLAKLTTADKAFFKQIDIWGGPINELHDKLNLNSTELSDYVKTTVGIPYQDSATAEIGDWVNAARYAEGASLRVAIKADKDTKASDVLAIIKRLNEKEMYRLILITSLAQGS